METIIKAKLKLKMEMNNSENLIENESKEKAVSDKSEEPYSKLRYFCDYHLKYIVIGAVLVCLIVYIIVTVTTYHKNIIIEGSALNASLTDAELTKLNEELLDYYGLDPEKNEVRFIDEFTIIYDGTDMETIAGNGTRMDLMNYINSNSLDYLILSEEALKNMNEYDAFVRIDRYLSQAELDSLSGRIVYLPVGNNLSNQDISELYSVDTASEGNDSSHVLPIAIDISDSKIFSYKRNQRMYIVFPSIRSNKENLETLINYIYDFE